LKIIGTEGTHSPKAHSTGDFVVVTGNGGCTWLHLDTSFCNHGQADSLAGIGSQNFKFQQFYILNLVFNAALD